MRNLVLLAGVGLAAALSPGDLAAQDPAASAPPVEAVRYGRDLRPILSDRCFRCHGPDATQRSADLRLDTREGALAPRDGGAAIVPGAPERSVLLARVASDDPDERMPPPESHKRALSKAEIDLLARWIAEGAPYEDHWAFVPPKEVALPTVANEAWCANGIDRFVLAELERRGLAPSPPAEKEVALRRLFLDLTGLPPTPEELDRFLADPDPQALRTWSQRLRLEEPYRTRYAERMGGAWLDLARYADTCGIHMDAGRQIWPYRDWVLRAFRDDLPFDRFLTEQVAGDLLPEPTVDQKIATGFLRAHVTTDEGGAIDEEYLVEYAADRATTVSSVFLGLTMGCARCHDHKYDPLTQEDFYSLYAFFNSNEEPGLYSQSPDPNRAHEPFLTVPTPEQQRVADGLRAQAQALREELARETPEDLTARAEFLQGLPPKAGLAWAPLTIVGARSVEGATLAVEADGSIFASGANPAQDEHHVELRTVRRGLRLLALEALADPRLPGGKVGRAPNGNAVLESVELEVAPASDPQRKERVKLSWAWADHEQGDGDYRATNVLESGDGLGWAVDAHRKDGDRLLLLLAEKPFGFDGGSVLSLRLGYRTQFSEHVLGRVRVNLAALSDRGAEMLPLGRSGWHRVGPFQADSKDEVFDRAFGPEQGERVDLAARFGAEGQLAWRAEPGLKDGQSFRLEDGTLATYVATRLYVPSARQVELSLGSDDGFRLYLDGAEVAQRRTDRAVAPDQDRATIALKPGVHWLVMKIANTGGAGGVYLRPQPSSGELAGDLALALLPAEVRDARYGARITEAWKTAFSKRHAQTREQLAAAERDLKALEDRFARTMVMKERAEPRPAYVLTRGAYDHPDRSRPVQRAVPAALGSLPEGAPRNRLGLAQWLVAAENPLVARVTVNRLWEWIFGQGLVRTSEDFGLQGEWPSHKELLDWLALELVRSGWRLSHVIDLMVTSSTYLQSSVRRPELDAIDSENLLLGRAHRRRLSAESIRDQALYVSGLLVERLGGPSVKPYQPDGLWQEVAMLQSNTRVFQRDEGEALWRRSLYTYWKRACPPPALMAFDAPTREFCTTRRSVTNTPLQALVLWNDEQHVEAARELAERTLRDGREDHARLTTLYRRTTGQRPDARTMERLSQALAHFRQRYGEAPHDARRLLAVGMAPRDGELGDAELAAWTMIASACLNLDTTITRS